MHCINNFYKVFMSGKDPRITAARPDLADILLKGIVNADRYVKGKIYQCVLGNIFLRAAPGPSSPQTSELLFGEHFIVFEEKDGWAWGQAQYDKYVGFVPISVLKPLSYNVHSRVSVPLTWIYTDANLKTHPLRSLPMGACLPNFNGSAIKGFVEIPNVGWIWEKHMTPLTVNLDYMDLAEKFLNTPYLWGGRTAMGVDCSGLTQVVLGMAGVSLPRDTGQQEIALGQDFSIQNWQEKGGLRRGDIVYFPGHVGLMVDDKNILHANATHMMTTINALDDVIDTLSKKFKSPITSVKRLTQTTK
jgi:hypothetical protein